MLRLPIFIGLPFKRFAGTAGVPAHKRANGAQAFAQINFRASRSLRAGAPAVPENRLNGPSKSLEG